MQITVSIYDLISWAVTIVSVMLFIMERRKNNRLPYYMAVQGILKACYKKAGFYMTYRAEIVKRHSGLNSAVPFEEHLFLIDTVYSDFVTLMEHIMGSLKAIEPEKDMPFDISTFTQSQKSPSGN